MRSRKPRDRPVLDEGVGAQIRSARKSASSRV
jgi:hypothetical protein